ncbi:MAG: hypothetical protein K2Q09_08795, partial [Phycisphaerales bacterium]|nr:hypothetical protein [Phycisphaerales bacterium]
GLTGLGDDGEVGGTGADADTVKNGSVGTLNFRGGTASVTVGAGLVAGADGLYNTADDQSAPGISTVASVQVVGTATNTVVRTDSGTPLVSTNLNGGSNAVGGQSLPVADGFAYAGATPGGVAVTSTGLIVTIGGQLRRLTFTGAGTATYSAGLNLGSGAGTLVLAGTTTASTLRIDAAPAGAVPVGTLRTVVGRDDASLGALNAANTDLTNLSVVLDGSINTVTARNLTNSPVRTGQSLGNVTAGAANSNTGLVVESRGTIGSVRTLGGVTNAGGVPASVQGLNIGTVSLAGQLNGLVSSDRDITSLTVNGPLTNGSGVRAGYNLGNTVVGSMSTATLSAGGNVGTVRVNGNATDSAILSGVDLGRDANFGGAGVNADTVTNGNMGAVTISGNFVRSDISAGGYQGADGFLGTQDDLLGEGRSTLGNVTVNGVAQGSLLNTESYRVFTNGTRGTVRAQGLPLTSTQNLAVVGQQAKPDALQVTGVNVQFIGGVYFATIGFNQPVDPSTIAAALSISEVRGAEPIATSIDLVQGADYTVTYSAGSTSALIQFSPAVTNRDLELDANNGATQSAAAGPGIFRFTIDSSAVRGQTSATRLDGDRDGVAEASDNWTSDFVIGDAGDRIQATHGLTANLDGVDFYGPANLDVVMGNTTTPDSPAANQLFNIQGVLGDHPDTNATFFGAGSDVDIYTVTLQQGQILDMGITQGGAQTTLLQLDAGGQLQNANVQGLADGRSLVLETGTYVIAVTSVAIDPFMAPGALTQPVVLQGPGADPNDLTGDVINIPNNGATGPYTLSVRIVDDGDNGFDGPTDASDGSNIENAPLPSAFSGGDGILGTQDDLAAITVGQYVYRLDAGANGAVNGNGAVNRRSDDMVIGVNQYGTEQVRTAGADGVFGTSDDLAAVNGSIGERNAVGGALVTANDVDIYRLNGGQPIVAGQRYRFTLRVSDYGGDLGTPHSPRPTPGGGVGVAGDDGRGQAQFALFELNGNGQNGGSLVAQAPNPEGFRARPNTVVATDGGTTYGYDANGDFYMELTVPPSQADANQDGRFALYVQGIHQSNYTVEIVNVGAGSTPTAQYQNFLIETNGGVVNWLNAFGGPSVLDRYTGSVAANVPGLGAATRAYILTQLVNNLNNIFAAAGVDARISLNSADFVGEAFSTVFVTDSLEPADYINQNFFGVSERRDVLNANRSDQAVVFAPALTALGNTVDQAGIDSYITSLTGSVVQRMGELLGLTFAEFDTGGAMVDGIPGAVNANALTPADLQFNSTESNLQQNLRSSFILGQQNDTQLLRRIFQLNT